VTTELGAHVHAELVRRGQTIASAESLTGGGVADALTAAPGASESFVGGVVSYATRVKTDLLDVPDSVVAEHGVVSAPCAAAMARGVRALLGTDWGVSTTGVAGPDSQEGQPVGRVYVGVDGPSGTTTHELQLEGDRAAIREAAVRQAVEAVLLQLQRGAPPADGPAPA
jgi:PncC family amidohydrolase